MDISERLLRLAKAYVRDWLKKNLPNEESENFDWEDSDFNAGSTADSRGKVNPKLELYYNRLEIPTGSDIHKVKTAWKAMMKRYHPDNFGRNPDKLKIATKVCQEVTEAYIELNRFLKIQSGTK